MNGEQLPLLNGFQLRFVVPGWYSTYWVKMLNDIEVLDQPDTNYWMKTAYTIPDTPQAVEACSLFGGDRASRLENRHVHARRPGSPSFTEFYPA